MKPWHLLVMVLLNIGWAGTIVINKALGNDAPPGSEALRPELLAGGVVTLRFGLAALCMVALWPCWRGPLPRGKDFFISLLIGVTVFVLGQRLQVTGVQLGTASDSSVLMAVEPVLASVAAAFFLREHIGPRRILGFALSIAGVVVLNRVWQPDFRWSGLLPSLIFVSSFLCETAYSILGKPIVQRASPAKLLTLALVGATAVNLLIDGPSTYHAAQALRPAEWLQLGYMAIICTVVGYTVWLVVIKEVPVNVVTLTIFIQPIAGVLLAATWLQEPLHWGHLWGSLLIVAGLMVALSRQIHGSPAPPAASGPP
jgi:drug/metabolite transporter (DMT)-like permease